MLSMSRVALLCLCVNLMMASGRLVVVEDEGLSLWDVEGMEGQRLHNVNLVGKQPRALHVHNMDAECSGGVRQR
jgi:hypothetical protein